jgi:chemotaxis signal transduction protein
MKEQGMNTATPATQSLTSRFILVQVSNQTLAIPASGVVEILRTPQIKILQLPFYHDWILGVTHHQGQIIPLLSTHLLIGQPPAHPREISTVVRLGNISQDITKVGLVIDRVIRSATATELRAETMTFDPKMIPADLWQPLY